MTATRRNMLHPFWLTFEDEDRERRFEARLNAMGVEMDDSVLKFMLGVRGAALCRWWLANVDPASLKQSALMSLPLPLEIWARKAVRNANGPMLETRRPAIVAASRVLAALRFSEGFLPQPNTGRALNFLFRLHYLLNGIPLQLLCVLGMPLKFRHQVPLQLITALIMIRSSKSTFCDLIMTPSAKPIAQRIAWICRVLTAVVLEDGDNIHKVGMESSPLPCREFMAMLNLFVGVGFGLFWWWMLEYRMRMAFVLEESRRDSRDSERCEANEHVQALSYLPWVLSTFLFPLFAMVWRTVEMGFGAMPE